MNPKKKENQVARTEISPRPNVWTRAIGSNLSRMICFISAIMASGGRATSVWILEFLSFHMRYRQAWWRSLTISFTFLSLDGLTNHLNPSSNNSGDVNCILVVKKDHTCLLKAQSKNRCCLSHRFSTNKQNNLPKQNLQYLYIIYRRPVLRNEYISKEQKQGNTNKNTKKQQITNSIVLYA